MLDLLLASLLSLSCKMLPCVFNRPLGHRLGLSVTWIYYWAWSWHLSSAFPCGARYKLQGDVEANSMTLRPKLCESWMSSSEMQSGKCEEWLSKTVLVRSHGRDGGGLALDEMGEQRRSGECAGEMEEQECSHPGNPPLLLTALGTAAITTPQFPGFRVTVKAWASCLFCCSSSGATTLAPHWQLPSELP